MKMNSQTICRPVRAEQIATTEAVRIVDFDDKVIVPAILAARAGWLMSAINAHDALVAACKATIEASQTDYYGNPFEGMRRRVNATRLAEEALAEIGMEKIR